MTEIELARLLSGVVRNHSAWDEDFGHLEVTRERAYTTISYTDSGIGEDYIRDAFRKKWPEHEISFDIFGGCDSCGYGRTIEVTFDGPVPP